VLLNEIMAHTDVTNVPGYDSDDWVELYNASGAPFAFGPDWYLSDDCDNLKRWPIPSTNALSAHGWRVFDEITGFHNPITNGFGLSKYGESLFLAYLPGTEQDRVVDSAKLRGQERDKSWGRYPDGAARWRPLAMTPGAANALFATQDLVISEIMYHPAPTETQPENNTGDEYVELYNPSPSPVTLSTPTEVGPWRVSGGVEYSFPSKATIAAGGYAVVVTFDPSVAALSNMFCHTYRLPDGQVCMYGPLTGRLDNGCDRVALERPVAPDLPGDPTGWFPVDAASYFHQAPWPAHTDGTGLPLQRVELAGSGNDPASWSDGFVATPGMPPINLATRPYGDWFYSVPIRIAGYGRAETLWNFPALISLSTNLPAFRYHQFASGSGGDLRFTDASGVWPLNYEIERWDTNGVSCVWVQVPALAGTDTCVWAYWGNPAATNPPACTTNGSVWSAGLAGVWHLHGTAAHDSSGHGLDGTVSGARAAEGKIDGALAYRSGAESVLVTNCLPATNALTVSAWVWADTVGDGRAIAENWGNATAGQFQLFLGANRALEARLAQANGDVATNRGPSGLVGFKAGQWHHVALVADGTRLRLYDNGTEVGKPADYAGALKQDFLPLGIGVRPDDSGGVLGERWVGVLDEVELSRVGRSSNWIWACWMAAASNDDFAVYGPVTLTDRNHDGIPDVWVWQRFRGVDGALTGPDDDWDHDGSANRCEFIAGTDPTNAHDAFRLTCTLSNGVPEVALFAVQADPDLGLSRRRYSLERTVGLGSWEWAGVEDYTNISGANRWVVYTNIDGAGAPCFYRARVWIQR